VNLLDAVEDVGRQVDTELAHDRPGQKTPAHPDLSMDFPGGSVDARQPEGVPPGEGMFVGAVDQRAVEVEEERGRPPVPGRRGRAPPGAASRGTSLHELVESSRPAALWLPFGA